MQTQSCGETVFDDIKTCRPDLIPMDVKLGGWMAERLKGYQGQQAYLVPAGDQISDTHDLSVSMHLPGAQHGQTLYILDEPTTGLHPSDVERLMMQLNRLVDAGNTVILVEHDMHVIAGSDWVIDIGPSAGEDGGGIVAAGTPKEIVKHIVSRTAPYLAKYI